MDDCCNEQEHPRLMIHCYKASGENDELLTYSLGRTSLTSFVNMTSLYVQTMFGSFNDAKVRLILLHRYSELQYHPNRIELFIILSSFS